MRRTLDIEFSWPVPIAGFAVRGVGSRVYLVPRGDEVRWHNPLSFHPALFRQFAALDEEIPEAAADFASRFGGLFGASSSYRRVGTVTLPGSRPGKGYLEEPEENFADWQAHIRRMRRLVSDYDEAIAKGQTTRPYQDNMRSPHLLLLLVDRGGRPGLSLTPDCLLSALDLQFYRVITGLSEVRACDQCGTWFECGAGKGRRAGSRFCSDKCRFDYHNAKKGVSA